MKPSIILGFMFMVLLAALTGGEVLAAMTSTNYEVRFDQLGSGGDDTSGSTSYILRDSVGTNSSQGTSSASYTLNAGFRSGIFDPAIDFEVFIQDRSSQVAATALSFSTVTVSSAGSISVGDMIAIVQDEGEFQVTAIGEVTGIVGLDVTVDFLTDGGTTPIIDGANDVVYILDGTSMPFGALSDSLLTTGIIAWEANVDTDEGYSVFVFDDGDLTNGSTIISDVTDGSVTAGSSEYGGRSSDTTLSLSTFDTVDSAFDTALKQIASRSGIEFKSRDFLTLKLSMGGSQEAGTYTQALTFIYVGDY